MEKKSARQVLAENLRTLMNTHVELNTQPKLAAKAKVAQTSISQILNLRNLQMKSPKLDQVEKIAGAYGLAAWQLLLNHDAVGKELAEWLTRPAVKDNDPRLKGWESPITEGSPHATSRSTRAGAPGAASNRVPGRTR